MKENFLPLGLNFFGRNFLTNHIISANFLKVAEINFIISVNCSQIQFSFSLIHNFLPRCLIISRKPFFKKNLLILARQFTEIGRKKYINHTIYCFDRKLSAPGIKFLWKKLFYKSNSFCQLFKSHRN